MTMNQYFIPDWSLDEECQTLHHLLPASNQKKTSTTHDNELVVQSQSTWKPPSTVPDESREDQKLDAAIENSSNPIQEDGPLSSFQYHLGDSLERDFSDYLCEVLDANAIYANKPNKAEDRNNFTMPPPKFGCAQQAPSLGNSGVINRLKDDLGSRNGGDGIGESSSVRTVGLSACGINQADISYNLSNGTKGAHGRGVKEGVQMNTFDPTTTLSSSVSGCSFGRTVGQWRASNQTHKRKGRDGDDSECHDEEAELESIAQRFVSRRKNCAAEVHNLSERRRRGRINEKMKALQELIPHCNKSDKASMLDEAIEYLKSLQLRLQIMWMGHASMPTMNNPTQMPRTPLINHSMPSTSNSNQMPLNPINFPRQMQTVHLSETSYAQYFGFPHMQVPQAMNLYAYGSHMVQQNQTEVATGSSSLVTAGIPPPEKIRNGQSG